MVRIRYTKQKDGSFKSDLILCGITPAHVLLHPSKLSFEIVNSLTNQQMYFETVDFYHQLRTKAKLATRVLGATYFDEIRNTKGKETIIKIEDFLDKEDIETK